MYIDKIMTINVVHINEQTRLSEMIEIMQKQNLEHLPVVQANGKLVGIVSQFDIQSAAPSAITTLSVGEANYLLAKITAEQIMQKEVIFCHRNTLIEEAGQIMRKHKISSLPVVNNQQLIGIVTMEDILDFFLDITGCHQEDATRIAVRLSDEKGGLSDFLHKINTLNCYIATVVSPTELDSEGKRVCIVRYYSDNPHEVDEQLKQSGFELISENFLAEQHDTIEETTTKNQSKTQVIANWLNKHDQLAKTMGIKTQQVAQGSCTLSMKVTHSLINAADVVHGGAVFALADVACAIAANSHNKVSLSMSGNINFLSGANQGDTLIAHAEEISLGNTIAVYQVEIIRSSDNKNIALFTGSVFRKNKPVIAE